jgi:hypothetical protein
MYPKPLERTPIHETLAFIHKAFAFEQGTFSSSSQSSLKRRSAHEIVDVLNIAKPFKLFISIPSRAAFDAF